MRNQRTSTRHHGWFTLCIMNANNEKLDNQSTGFSTRYQTRNMLAFTAFEYQDISTRTEGHKTLLLLFSCQVVSSSCDPMDCSPPGSSVHGTIPARILKWLPFPPSGDLPDPGIKPLSPAALAPEGGFSTTEPPGKCQSFQHPST